MSKTKQRNINLIIVGAGKAGDLISTNILKDKDSSFNIIGFVDDDKTKIGKTINGIKVLGNFDDIYEVAKESQAKEILIAIPSERGEVAKKILDRCATLRLNYKILPRTAEILIQKYNKDYIQHIRKLQPEDILGGEITKADQEDVAKSCKESTILITGAAGSIGSELSRQFSAYGSKKLIFFDWWENGMFELQNYIEKHYPNQDCEFIIGNVKDRRKLSSIMSKHKPNTVFHAAAYKHVPIMESNGEEAIKNNIFGTKIMAETSIRHGVEKFVLISSDKAVNPTNIMGVTKRAAEKVIHILSEAQDRTVFCAVRFGNVVNSNGSAIPIFERQIESGGPVTVTHPEINRFFMTIPEAVHLILQAWTIGENNDLFVLDMGEPVKIVDLARYMIIMNGYHPEEDVKIKIIGLRPGEKIFEEMLAIEENIIATKKKKIFRTKNYMDFDKLAFLNNLSMLDEILAEGLINPEKIRTLLKKIVSTYKPTLLSSKG